MPVSAGAGIDLASRMASSASGWAVVTDGVLNVRTVSDSANSAAAIAVRLAGIRVMSNCNDPDCDCRVRLIRVVLPKAQLVRVSVQLSPEEPRTAGAR